MDPSWVGGGPTTTFRHYLDGFLHQLPTEPGQTDTILLSFEMARKNGGFGGVKGKMMGKLEDGGDGT